MVAIKQMTELEAVNLILKNMGEAPVNSLSGALPLEASQAFDVLIEVSKEVQTKGWYFNTEYRRLAPDHQGHITLPVNTLSVQTIGDSRGLKVIARGNRLYNISPFANTFKFDGAVSVQIVLGLEFNELPSTARNYIALKAARIAQVRTEGDDMLLNEDKADENEALALLMAEQLRAEPLSLLESTTVLEVASGRPSNYVRLI